MASVSLCGVAPVSLCGVASVSLCGVVSVLLLGWQISLGLLVVPSYSQQCIACAHSYSHNVCLWLPLPLSFLGHITLNIPPFFLSFIFSFGPSNMRSMDETEDHNNQHTMEGHERQSKPERDNER